jgi:hypothetical protein
MSVVDMIVLLAFIVVAVVGAEVVRMACRRQLTAVPAERPPVAAEATAGAVSLDAD